MIYIRSIIFNVFFFSWTALVSSLLLPCAFLPGRMPFVPAVVWSSGVLFGLKFIANITYEEKGRENLPKEGAFIIASKHQSAWDTVIFLNKFAGSIYVLKKELLKIPFYGQHLIGMKMIPIDRSGGMNSIKIMLKCVRERIAEGHVVTIFPEGTRTKYGEKKPYQPGVALIYKEVDAPIIPVSLDSGRFWARNSFLKYPGKITVIYHPQMPKGLDKKEFMQKLQDAIEN